MYLEVKRSVGRAKCFICQEKIKAREVQLVFTGFGGYPKSCHHKCINERVEAHIGCLDKLEEADKLLDK